MYFKGRKQAQKLTCRRLRVLYDLHCIDRFFPVVEKGSPPQHLVLDYGGVKVLDIENFKKTRRLPIDFKHKILQTEFRIRAKEKGFSWGKREEKIGPIRADLYYPNFNMAVEIDRGTETKKTLKKKIKKYNRLINRDITVIFVTSGNEKRGDFFSDKLIVKNASSHFRDLEDLLNKMKNKFLE